MASEDLLKKAVAAFNALSPEQQAEMLEEQRQSWVRGNVGLSRDDRDMTSPMMREVENRLAPLIKAVNSWADSKTTPVAPVSSEPFEDNALELARCILGADTGLTINPLPRCEGPQNVRPRYAIWGDDLEALAKAALKSVAPVSPDATGKCGELVTVRTEYRWGGDPKWKVFGPIFDDDPRETRELVTRSQAVELLAAERAESVRTAGIASEQMARAEKAEADNAALTARVREYETGLVDFHREMSALEAKPAAAEKALEPFAEHANDRAVDDTGWRDKETVKIVVSIGDLRKARAALGGKPS